MKSLSNWAIAIRNSAFAARVIRAVLADAELTYSQEGEDRILLRLVNYRSKGFYVDVGAHHPTRFSNTQLLYSRGWRGINIEPNPGSKRVFDRARPRDINLELAIDQQGGPLAYYIFDEPALNTTSEARATEIATTTNFRLVRKASIPTKPLATVLAAHVPSGESIDVLNIDAEGSDLDVLKSNDWVAYRPGVVLVEDLAARRQEGLSEIASLLGRFGYELVAKTLNTGIFMPHEASATTGSTANADDQ